MKKLQLCVSLSMCAIMVEQKHKHNNTHKKEAIINYVIFSFILSASLLPTN
eukprot:m.112607 g.112607  ORF g.112607 m.112607 type:complete len:51 (-) comp9256_c9_seq1:1606-1758(-)